ncbi:MAG: hypothetical protein FOGNACKC_05456 [Anaerolineae bacterium]|nr:hypothetical protein [Anaerolineae bacterium]
MKLNRPRVPIGLLISGVITLILGFAAGPVIESLTTEQQRATNVLLSAIPFVLIFASIIIFFISFIWLVATALNGQVPATGYRVVETVIIAGIVLGIFGMFQPWLFAGYKYGFLLLLFSTLSFILWSHVTPAGVHAEHVGSVSISEFEHKESHT